MSRRSALGWILGGAAVAALAGGAGLFFYSKFHIPDHALSVLQGHSDAVTSICWSPDGTQLASGSRDKTAKLWQVASGQNTVTYRGHSAAIMSVAWRPVATVAGLHLLASGGDDESVQVWDTQAVRRRIFQHLGAPVSSVSWSLDGGYVLVGTLGSLCCPAGLFIEDIMRRDYDGPGPPTVAAAVGFPLVFLVALGAAAAQLGPDAQAAAVVELNKQGGLSQGKVTRCLENRFGMRLSRGGSVPTALRTASRCEPVYEAIRESVGQSEWVVLDETGGTAPCTVPTHVPHTHHFFSADLISSSSVPVASFGWL